MLYCDNNINISSDFAEFIDCHKQTKKWPSYSHILLIIFIYSKSLRFVQNIVL